MKHTLIFSDGTQVSSGADGSAILSVRHSAAAFSGTQADPGSVCAGELEAELFDAGLTLRPGQQVVLSDETGTVGTFFIESVTRPAPGRLRLLAYDTVTRLDVDVSDWLAGLSQWPYTLAALADALASHCGVTLTGQLANPDYPVPKFLAQDITARQLMQWICQAGGCFCRAAPDGSLRLDWICDKGRTLESGTDAYCCQGSFRPESWETAPIGGVQVALTETDAGTCYPPDGENILRIQGNYLLRGDNQALTQALYERLTGFSYTPCTLTTNTALEPGEIFRVVSAGRTYTCLAMTVERAGGLFRVTGTGTARRDSPASLAGGSYQALSGRVLALQYGLQGVSSQLTELSETGERMSELTQDVRGITARVSLLETDTASALDTLERTGTEQFAQLTHRADSLELTLGTVRTDLDAKAEAEPVQELRQHFRFDDGGLTIHDSATGMSIRVSQEEVAFLDGTVITPTDLRTDKLQVGSRLELGGFVLLPRSSGNLSLRSLST